MKPRSVPVGLAAVALLTFGVKAPAITYTAIMNGENSTKFSFLNNNINPRSTVTSIQSPFAYPTTITGSTDTQTYPSGNSSATPPWWFYYSGNFIANDSTGVAIGRPGLVRPDQLSKIFCYRYPPEGGVLGNRFWVLGNNVRSHLL